MEVPVGFEPYVAALKVQFPDQLEDGTRCNLGNKKGHLAAALLTTICS